MFGTFIYTLLHLTLLFINWVLQLFNLPYISNMTDAITWFFKLFWIGQGFFPVDTLFQCLTVLALVYFFRFQIRLFFHTVFPLIPFIGKRIDLPRIDGYDDMSQPYYQALRGSPDNMNGMGSYYVFKRKKK